MDIDDRKASAMKLATSDINSTLSTALGGTYVNDFIDRSVSNGYMQGDAPFRMNPEDLRRWHVRNGVGEMVPMVTFAKHCAGPTDRHGLSVAAACRPTKSSVPPRRRELGGCHGGG